MMRNPSHIIRRRAQRRQRSQTGLRRVLRWLANIVMVFTACGVLAGLAGIGAALGVYAHYAQQLPEPTGLGPAERFGGIKLYDRTGQHLLYEVINPVGDRTWVNLADIPASMRNATIASDDKSFYDRPANDLGEIVRAVWSNLFGDNVQVGSPIAWRLATNNLLNPLEPGQLTFDQKMRELALAVRINEKYSRDEILEWYLNTNYYGNFAYGIEAAASLYFDKPVDQLTLSEAAMLAAIPQSPGSNPMDDFDEARARQGMVLNEMVGQGFITQAEADAALASPMPLYPFRANLGLTAPHFLAGALKQLQEVIDPVFLAQGSLVVYTTLDYDLYLQVECVARSHVARLSGQPPSTIIPTSAGTTCEAAQYLQPVSLADLKGDQHITNASVVVIDPATGEVLALMGSLNYDDEAISGALNMAVTERQPGSMLEPFIYLTAFQQGYTPATMVLDVRTTFDMGNGQQLIPENFDRQFHGPMSIRAALANSYTVPAVQILNWVGVDSMLRTAHAMGINTLDRGSNYYRLSLVLGGGEITLYDLTYSSAVLANLGAMRGRSIPDSARREGFRTLDPTMILRIENLEGDVLWEYGIGDTVRQEAIVDPSLAYLINHILADDDARRPTLPPASAAMLTRPASVQLGTTGDFTDIWAVGYTPQLVIGVWVGNADNSPVGSLPAIAGAAPIWKASMEYAYRTLPLQDWQRPANIEEITVCEVSGLLPTANCPVRQEIFIAGIEPTTQDTMYQVFSINRDTGLLATVYTPSDLIEQKIYQIFPPEAADWVRETGVPQPPTSYDLIISAADGAEGADIQTPQPFSYVSGVVSIRGNVRDTDLKSYRLDFGTGLNPDGWTQIGVDHFQPVENGVLGIWDTTGLDGLYSLRLSVVLGNDSVRQFVLQVTVDNIPPTLSLSQPQGGQQYHLSDEFITIQAVVADNIYLDRVEFLVDGALIASRGIAPYSQRWIISSVGTHIIQVRAYDAAGNSIASDKISIQITP